MPTHLLHISYKSAHLCNLQRSAKYLRVEPCNRNSVYSRCMSCLTVLRCLYLTECWRKDKSKFELPQPNSSIDSLLKRFTTAGARMKHVESCWIMSVRLTWCMELHGALISLFLLMWNSLALVHGVALLCKQVSAHRKGARWWSKTVCMKSRWNPNTKTAWLVLQASSCPQIGFHIPGLPMVPVIPLILKCICNPSL